jgi:hypothetical protein
VNLKRSKFRYLDPRQALKTSLSRISATSELRTWLCSKTIATFIGNVCLSRHWKVDSISFKSCIRTLASITHLMAQKPDRTTTVQSVHNVSRTKVGHQNAVTTEPYIEMSHMSNQRKAEIVGDFFHMRSFWGGHSKILPRTCFIQEAMMCQKCYFSIGSSFRLS